MSAGPELPRIGLYAELRDPTAKYDKLGRQQPRRLSLPMLLMAIPQAPGRTRRVPARAVVEEKAGEEALIACPCGGQPVAPADRLEKCPGCERFYAYLGDRALVFYGDMEIPAVTPD